MKGFKALGDLVNDIPSSPAVPDRALQSDDVERHARGLVTLGYRKAHGRSPTKRTVDALRPMAAHLLQERSRLLRAQARRAQATHRHAAPEQSFAAWKRAVVSLIATALKGLPGEIGKDPCGIEVELWALSSDPLKLVADVALTVMDPDGDAASAMPEWADEVEKYAQKIKDFEIERVPHPDAFPDIAAKTQPVEFMGALFRGTPFRGMLRVYVPLSIPVDIRCGHTHVIMCSGGGKTQSNQLFIQDGLGKHGQVVFDTKGGLGDRLIRHGGRPQDIVYIDPTSRARPLINVARAFPGVDKARVADQIEFVLRGLGLKLTDIQSSVLGWGARMVAHIPNATIHTLLDIIRNSRDAQFYMQRYPADVQKWVANEYDKPNTVGAREWIVTKLYGLVNNDGAGALANIICCERTTLDMKKLLDAKKTVIIRLDEQALGDNLNVVARTYLASIESAMWRRSLPVKGVPWIIYIDEFGSVVGTKDDKVLINLVTKGREFKVGLHISHQQIDGQLSGDLEGPFLTNAQVRLMCNPNEKDAKKLSANMGCAAAFLMNLPVKKDEQSIIAVHVAGVISRATHARLKFGQMEDRTALGQAKFDQWMRHYVNFWDRMNDPSLAPTAQSDGRHRDAGNDAKVVMLGERVNQPGGKSRRPRPWDLDGAAEGEAS